MFKRVDVALYSGWTPRYAIHCWKRGQSSLHPLVVLSPRSLHTTRQSSAADRREGDKQTPSSTATGGRAGGSDDSVLVQIFRKKEQSKQLTVGAKGRFNGSCVM